MLYASARSGGRGSPFFIFQSAHEQPDIIFYHITPLKEIRADNATLTFGGMCSWRRVAVARVFALVVRCRVMRLLLYSRVGKNRDTRRGSPAGAGAACAAIEGLSF